MNLKVLEKEVQEFIIRTADGSMDINTLILSGSPFEGVSIQEIAHQIVGRRKAKTKLPTWYQTTAIVYPPKLNLEQTSSEQTALYKSKLVGGHTLIDLTGGFGIDDYFFADRMQQVIHCELNESLSAMAAHNFKTLDKKNISTYSGNGLDKLATLNHVDWVYIDPSRRHGSKGKVFFLEDCEPNVPKHLDFLFSKTDHILIKTSPLLDIQSGLKSLKHVKEIHVIALYNEVKELLWILDRNIEDQTHMATINMTKSGDQQKFNFILEDETTAQSAIGPILKYLYEPNSAILKSGGFQSVSNTLGLSKLHQHSHLYTSDSLQDFPGRRFEIMEILPYNKKSIRQLGISKANITTRNFSENVAQLRKKLKIKDGGTDYLFFTTNYKEERTIIHCKKV